MSNKARLLLLGASHHTVPLNVREKLAIPTERLAEFQQGLQNLPGIDESVVLNTCNRLEVYCVLKSGTTEDAIETYICNFQNFPLTDFQSHRHAIWNRQAVEHLLEVASGVDSQMIGETEIFGQVKDAYAFAAEQKSHGPVLHRVFQKAFQAAKHIRNSAPIGEGQISLTSVAIDLATKIFGSLEKTRVLVIGTGEIGEKAARAFAGRGARDLTVLSRQAERASVLAETVGAKAGTFDELNEAVRQHDIVIGSTNTTDPIVKAETLHEITRTRRLRPLFLIDLGVPRNFDPAAGELESVFVYDLDDLVRIADDNLAARRAAIAKCKDIAHEKAATIWEKAATRLLMERPDKAARPLSPHEQTM